MGTAAPTPGPVPEQVLLGTDKVNPKPFNLGVVGHLGPPKKGTPQDLGLQASPRGLPSPALPALPLALLAASKRLKK